MGHDEFKKIITRMLWYKAYSEFRRLKRERRIQDEGVPAYLSHSSSMEQQKTLYEMFPAIPKT